MNMDTIEQQEQKLLEYEHLFIVLLMGDERRYFPKRHEAQWNELASKSRHYGRRFLFSKDDLDDEMTTLLHKWLGPLHDLGNYMTLEHEPAYHGEILLNGEVI